MAGHAAVAERAIRSARAASPSTLKFAVVRPSAALLPEWAVIANRSAGDNLFFHPDFAVPAMTHLGDDVAIGTVAGAGSTSGGRLAALAPFTQSRLGRIAPAVRLWSHDYAPLGLPLIEDSSVEPAAAALIEGLAASAMSLIVPELPLDGPVAAALASAAHRQGRPMEILDRHVRAVLDRPLGRVVDLRATLPAKRRKEFGRQMRRLSDLGMVRIETVSDLDTIRAGFETFMALEAAGWKGKRGTALISSQATADFAREAVVNRAVARGARIDSITVDGEPIAMVVSFVAGQTAFTWKITYDEAYARFSPGAQLMLEVAGSIFADPSVMRIDSCAAPDHPMIDHLWTGRMTLGTMVIGPPGGSVLHRIGLAAAKAEIAARATVRRLRA